MAISYTWNSGTSSETTWNTTTNTGTSPTNPFSNHFPSIRKKAPKAPPLQTKSVDEVFKKKSFWDGVEWKETTVYTPKKTITGKIAIGKVYKRERSGKRRFTGHIPKIYREYAKKKELFEEKLKGNA